MMRRPDPRDAAAALAGWRDHLPLALLFALAAAANAVAVLLAIHGG